MADKELEIPYHVLAISELAKNYNAAAFQVEIGQCREVIAKLAAEDNRSDQQRARYRILRYLDLQLTRSVSWVEKEADLMAWVMRNLIELKFWAKFVSESEQKATQFVNESNIDLREVSERLNRLMPDDAETMPPLPPNSDGKRVGVRPSGAHYDPNYTKKTEEVCKVLEAQPISTVLRVDQFAAAVDFDPLGCIRVLVRHGYFKSVSSPRKKVQGYQRGPNWPPPESFLESGPVGFTYFVTKWFRYLKVLILDLHESLDVVERSEK